MSELVKAVDVTTQMLGKCLDAQADPKGFRKQVISRLTRWFEEGLDLKTVIEVLIERQKEKQDALVLGEINHDYLDLGDFDVIERKMGINEVTPANRSRWQEKFKSGRAKYICPQCGYAGNSEFVEMDATFGRDFLRCGLGCGYFGYCKYFTREWTPEEQATFEQECEAKRQANAAAATQKAELDARRKKLFDKVRAEAVAAVNAIEEFQWVLNGDDIEAWSFDEREADDEIKRVMQLILRPQIEGWGPLVPQDEIVSFFKANMKPCGDDETPQGEFTRCAKAFTMEMIRAMEGADYE